MASRIADELVSKIRMDCGKKVYMHSNKDGKNNDILQKTVSKMVIRNSVPIALSTSFLLGGIFTLIYEFKSILDIGFLNIFTGIIMILVGSIYLLKKYFE